MPSWCGFYYEFRLKGFLERWPNKPWRVVRKMIDRWHDEDRRAGACACVPNAVEAGLRALAGAQ